MKTLQGPEVLSIGIKPPRCIQQRSGSHTKHEITMQDASDAIVLARSSVNFRKEDIKRFWAKVETNGKDECWQWLGCKTKDGYGRFVMFGRAVRAHRVAFVISNGEIVDGLVVCHKCDNPSCCNPSHLFSGTPSDNMKDRDSKGRQACGPEFSAMRKRIALRGDEHPFRKNPSLAARGEKSGRYTHPEKTARGEGNGRAVMTELDVLEIRTRHTNGENFSQIAASKGLKFNAVRRCALKISWGHL